MPVPWAGHDRDLVRIANTPSWKSIMANDTLVKLALDSLPPEFHNLTRQDVLLLADVRQGGALLAAYLPGLTEAAGFPDRKGRMTGISSGALRFPSQSSLPHPNYFVRSLTTIFRGHLVEDMGGKILCTALRTPHRQVATCGSLCQPPWSAFLEQIFRFPARHTQHCCPCSFCSLRSRIEQLFLTACQSANLKTS